MPRTPLDCHKRVDWLRRRKHQLGAAALVLTLAWLSTSFVTSDQGDLHASRGGVTSVHQALGTQCSACHEPFTPISSHSWAAPFLGDPQVSSQRCQQCHEGAVHHAGQQPDLTCASCHREHRGPNASLVDLPDRDCTQCHRDLSKHHAGKVAFHNDVSRFSNAGHPEFRSIKSDPGKLKFNHQRHLTAGMPVGVDGGAVLTLARLPESARQRYRDQQPNKDDAAPVQLQCAACHQPDAGGAYMRPVSYDQHCQACHPLTIERKVADDPRAGHFAVPHRWQPREIHELLEAFYTSQVARGDAGLLSKKAARPLPGKLPDLLGPTLREAIDKKVERTEKDLYLSSRLCAECHHFTGKNRAEAIQPAQPPDLQIAPTQVPRTWLQHAKFNHSAHRAVQCSECHGNAQKSQMSADVLVPDRASCVQCHAPKTNAGVPGARHNCTQCHLYHNGDHARRSKGAQTPG